MGNVPGLLSHEQALICQVCAQFPAIKEVVLFGSRAMGSHRQGSDVDLAVRGLSAVEVLRVAEVLNEETNLPYVFDVIASETITNEKLREHIASVGISLLA